MPKHNHTLADGTRGEVCRFMQLPTLPAGYWWADVAPLGSDIHDWRQIPEPPTPDGSKIFGYDARAFLARQYK